MNSTDRWAALASHCAELDALRGTLQVLGWDQQTYLPAGGHKVRGDQMALLARLSHERLVDPAFHDLLQRLADEDLPSDRAAAVHNLRRTVERAIRVPPRLVEALSRAESEGFSAWAQAKSADDYAGFAPFLAHNVALKKEEAAAIDGDRHPYDVLLEPFDPGTTLATLRPLFHRLVEGLAPLIDAARGRPHPTAIDAEVPVAAQRALNTEVMTAVGFDLQAGRLDDSEHPFSTGIGQGDVRITTHLHEADLLGGLGSTLHEAGHGMYEQGLVRDWPGTTLDEAASYGLHESQSRFWENQIGRSLPFCRWLAPKVQQHTGLHVSAEALYGASNTIRPSLIRVMADEATYNLHILVRFELEVALVEGALAVADLPGAWSEAYQRHLGLRPPNNRQGCLQDVHWSGGAIGYFPSYTLGNLYAARLAKALERDLPSVWDDVERGQFAPVLAWLRTHVHQHGHGQHAGAIVDAAAGPGDGVDELLDHLWSRHGALYGLSR